VDEEDKGLNEKTGEDIMICPRCDSKTANLLIASPVGNEWEMYICNECNFTWRSTEPEDIRDPEMYDPKFKLSKEKISKMVVNPPIATSKKQA
jgi:protein-arginine kinase activator protein McsA